MSRNEFSATVRPQACNYICAACLETFCRPYAVSFNRTKKPMYCSHDCVVSARKARASVGLNDRFWAKITRGNSKDCWPWRASKARAGYGCFFYDGRLTGAHRVAYLLSVGPIPDNIEVCHKCDNPGCCNPSHLFLGTHAENLADMAMKGRRILPSIKIGENNHQAKLTAEQAKEIFNSQRKNKDLALSFGVTSTTIYLIKTGKKWASITGARHA